MDKLLFFGAGVGIGYFISKQMEGSAQSPPIDLSGPEGTAISGRRKYVDVSCYRRHKPGMGALMPHTVILPPNFNAARTIESPFQLLS